jgi:hypothetical protein
MVSGPTGKTWLTMHSRKHVRDSEESGAKMPGTSFSQCNIMDVLNPTGLHLDISNIDHLNIQRPSMFIPDTMLKPVASDLLCQNLKILDEVWAFNSEQGCRSRIDAILAAAVHSPDKKLRVFCEVKNDWIGPGFYYTGSVDYMIGSGCTIGNTEVDSCLVCVEAKKEGIDSGIAQILAELGCLQKNRLIKGKNSPVFGILTNGTIYQFYSIDMNSIVYCSGSPMVLRPEPDGSYDASGPLAEILRWVMWFCSTMRAMSPGFSPVTVPQDAFHAAIAQLETCFRKVT